MNKQDADIAADNLLRELLKSQPNLIGPVSAHPENGKLVGEFINALHSALSDGYQKRN